METIAPASPDDQREIDPRFPRLTVSDCHKVLRLAHGYAAMATEDHPPGWDGLLLYGEGCGAFRMITRPKGWGRCDRYNIGKAVTPDGTIAVVVMQGDAATGDPHLRPKTKNPRKVASIALIERNRQLELFGAEYGAPEVDMTDDPGPIIQRLWYFLHYRAGDIVRAELAQPVSVDEEGHVSAWVERIPVPSLDLAAVPTDDTDEDGPDIDVQVERR